LIAQEVGIVTETITIKFLTKEKAMSEEQKQEITMTTITLEAREKLKILKSKMRLQGVKKTNTDIIGDLIEEALMDMED